MVAQFNRITGPQVDLIFAARTQLRQQNSNCSLSDFVGNAKSLMKEFKDTGDTQTLLRAVEQVAMAEVTINEQRTDYHTNRAAHQVKDLFEDVKDLIQSSNDKVRNSRIKNNVLNVGDVKIGELGSAIKNEIKAMLSEKIGDEISFEINENRLDEKGHFFPRPLEG